MSNTVSRFLCIALLAFCIVQTPSLALNEGEKPMFRFRFKVHIVNGFADNSKPLVTRCHSNDDDLGSHTLWKGQEFKFEFFNSITKKTHFVCSFRWGTKFLDNISVYTKTIENHTCKDTGNCFWKAQEDGIYFSNNFKDWEKRFSW